MAANESLSVNFNNLRDLYMKFELAEGICLPVLSVLTVSTNILLLIAIWKDPGKNFRSPTTYFLIGLAIADLLTGMSTEPFFAVYHIMNFQSGGKPIPRVVAKLYNIGQSISTVTISSSYLIILGLSISQYIAIKWPHKYKVLITRNRVIVSVLLSWLYFIFFTLVPSLTPNIDYQLFLKVDLALHPVLISTILFTTLILLYRVFSQEVQRRRSYRKSDSQKGTVRGKSENLQRQFVIVTFYLAAILLISALPHIAIQFVWLYVALSEEGLYYTFMALRVRDLLLFLKVALDAFIYAWRLPSYRKALKRSINHSRRDSKSSVEVKG
nr:alpha-1A adrenergic receptor-like [Pocillopora verrucosa]